ncbi:Uncharacterised protein [Mycobacteroides abscessus subsp. abscessus]|uniref:hypothetical protein n=1 Tax=Mycobacteroides abscessus TaxID=36809 RepID=UPI00092BBC1F|nr:hypothetical protein [Mycobacteroides abscessus]SHU63874.1 Uncharacterised protein [Mycobacteroides abscessus subsp. abscessus]
MSISNAGLNRDLGEPHQVFERLCQVLCHELVSVVLPDAQVLKSQTYDHNYDGGTEAVVWTSAGHQVGIQAKGYTDFQDERDSAVKSFEKMLRTPQRDGVTHFLWCSTFKRNVDARGRDIDVTLDRLVELADERSIIVEFVGLGDIRRLLCDDLAELDQLYFGQGVVSADDLRDYTAGQVHSVLDRVGGPGDEALHFDSKLEGVLDTFTYARLETPLSTAHVRVLVDELDHRMRLCSPHPAPVVQLRPLIGQVLDHVKTAPAAEFDVSDLSRLLSDCEERMWDLYEQMLRTPAGQRGYGAHRLGAVCISVRAIAREFTHLTSMAHALRSGVLVVSGQWGTGKTYHLARHMDKLTSSTRSLLLLRAKHFEANNAPILSQSWRDNLVSPRISANGILAILDALAPRGGVSVLAIDGLNEWPGRVDHLLQLQLLTERLPRFAHVKVIVTLRSDRPNPSLGPAEYRHSSPDRVHIARALAEHLGQPVIPYWSGALANPLTARIAAVIAARKPEGMRSLLSPISFSDLAAQWVALHADEYAASESGRSGAVVFDLVDALADAGGRATRRELRDAIRGTELSHNVIDYLVTNGCFEDTGNHITFRWEQMGELSHARLLARHDSEKVTELLKTMSPSTQERLLRLLADQCPLNEQPRELPDWLSGHEDDLLPYFVESLANRANDKYTNRSRQLAAIAFRRPDLAQRVCFAALSNPLGPPHSVCPGWLAGELVAMRPRQRAKIWPKALGDCLYAEAARRARYNNEYSDVVSSIATWTASDACNWDAEQQEGVARLLIWFSWIDSRIEGSVYEYAVRQLAELLHVNPDIARTLVSDCAQARDQHLYEIVTAAALGALLRWPHDPRSAIAGHVVHEAMLTLRPQMFRALVNLFRIGQCLGQYSATTELHAFLRRVGKVRRYVIRDRVLAGMQTPARRRRSEQRRDARRREDLADERLRTYAANRLASMSRKDPSLREIPAEEVDLFDALYLQYQASCGYPDPTVPVSVNLRYSVQDHQQWWIVTRHPGALADITVVDPAGVHWIVLDGQFRFLTPRGPAARDRIWLSNAITGPDRYRDEGLPSPGQHETQRVLLHTTFDKVPISAEDIDLAHEKASRPGRFLFADDTRFGSADEAPWSAALLKQHDAPDPALSTLLQAQWTGEHLNYVHNDTLVITDPALVAGGGPRALLVRGDQFLSALHLHNITATVQITVDDPRDSSFESFALEQTHSISLGGQRASSA